MELFKRIVVYLVDSFCFKLSFWLISRSILVFLLILQIGNFSESYAGYNRNLTIFADQNLMFPLIKIARIYSQKNNAVVSISFIATAEEDKTLGEDFANNEDDIVSKIQAGEPVDLIISANKNIINNLKQKGLLDFYNTGIFSAERLVIATSVKNKINLSDNFHLALRQLNAMKSSIIIDNEQNTAGQYAADLLKQMRIGELEIVHKLSEDYETITKLISKNSDKYFLVLTSQVANNKNIKIIASSDFVVNYQALVVAGENMKNAREFIKFLRTAKVEKILKENNLLKINQENNVNSR
jgi:ABC-type molybdate transport system substrate-binding protein